MGGLTAAFCLLPTAYCLLLSSVLCGGLEGLQDSVQKELLGQRPLDRGLLVDHGLGDGVNAVLSRQVRKLGRLDAIRRDERASRSEEHTSELQSRLHLVCRLLLEKKKTKRGTPP